MFQGGEMMNDTFMKEKPVLPLILSILVNFSIQHYRQPFRRADQRGSYDGIITGLPGSKFYQCGWNWIWRWNQRSDRLLSRRWR